MAEVARRRWTASFEGASRQDRRGCNYETYLPDPLAHWDPLLPGDIAADLADAEQAVRQLNEAGTRHVSLEGLARFLLRAECVASSRIEGLVIAPRRLLEAEVALSEGGPASDRVAVEVLGNVAAQEAAIEFATQEGEFTTSALLEIHRRLTEASLPPEYVGELRTVQNWIGGSGYNPCSAAFVPPPPEQVEGLIDDLVVYVNGDAHPPLVQAAIAHAQFETIHPFVDGNGRVGRALIHVVLRRRRVATSFVPPVSLVLATWSDAYIGGLTAFRHLGPPRSPRRSEAAHEWLRTFATTMRRACDDAETYASRIDEVVQTWRASLGAIRAGSSIQLLLDILPGAPIVTVESAARLIRRSNVRVGEAINRLVESGILHQRNVGRQRYRVFEARDVLDLFTGLERALASPSGNTLTDPPVRTVPARPPSGHD
jgi:Fic family protein